MNVVAYGPILEDLPFIPEFVILEREGETIMAFRTTRETLSSTDLHGMSAKGKIALLDTPVAWRDDSWPSVEPRGLKWFFLSDEKRWREARAKSLLREAKDVSGDPVRKLSLLTASGGMGEVDVPGLVSELEKHRKSASESLLDIYKRVERKRETNL